MLHTVHLGLCCGKQTYYGKLKFSIRQPKIFIGVRTDDGLTDRKLCHNKQIRNTRDVFHKLYIENYIVRKNYLLYCVCLQ
jgi:hypothetical protein